MCTSSIEFRVGGAQSREETLVMGMDPRGIEGPGRLWSHCGALVSPHRGVTAALMADGAARPPFLFPFPNLVLGVSEVPFYELFSC